MPDAGRGLPTDHRTATGITDEDELRANLRSNCVPESMLDGVVPDYDAFLEERRKLMALKVKSWFESL